ncbi:cryptochrome/photolyase family protein [Aurantibacillus circumpalustris]|uniref:cryptochrome/photolyase family protein n=1 Tax=Aurantibacillus circumpalustris TaxID=3036359 RepID=UPI00295B8F47|nr:deoxyribodipyrimidine photo-lyase [Aurantibacillus circumpalustris]
MADEHTLFWFRRDLRLNDNAGLYHALRENKSVLPIFIFDTTILNQLENKYDRRVDFIHQAISKIHKELLSLGSSLLVHFGTTENTFKSLLKTHGIKNVYANHDYEPQAIERDLLIKNLLEKNGIEFKTFKDQCVFEKTEITKDDGKPYTVFTPYSNKWKKALIPFYYRAYPTKKYFKNFATVTANSIPELKYLGFEKTDIRLPEKIKVNDLLIQKYKEQRDYPAIEGTSRLSVHLRFGTVSIRQLVAKSLPLSETWLNELIWRDFYMMILSNFPHVAKSAFKKDYDYIRWRNNEVEFEKWCKGETGFPIVDAGMRELNATGFMHNRVRMITSSFLIKDLLIDWRWGEAYFAQKLNDFDLSANNGGWQWAASSGCDAAPYFRIFNPTEQQKRFDPYFIYIKKWVPEFGTKKYPGPMVDHAEARLRTLSVYKNALSESKQMNLF